MKRLQRQRGFFLVLVLVVIAVATMGVSTFTETMLMYDDAAYLQADRVQARMAAESGIQTVRLLLSQPPDLRADFGSLYNNPELFQAAPVGGVGNTITSSFTIVGPSLQDDGRLGGLRYGLQDESARLNLNILPILEGEDTVLAAASLAATSDDLDVLAESSGETVAETLLMSLPSMTIDVAQAIMDWIDEDDEPRTYGAEADYYETLATPYTPPNGPIRSVEDLLLVRGVTPSLLFGADVNRNGVMDADEQVRSAATIETSGVLGWASYLTVWSQEASKTRAGDPRVNVNQDDLETLYDELLQTSLGELYTSFIVAYRMYGEPPVSLTSVDGLAQANAQDQSSGDVIEGGVWTADVFEQLDLSAGAAVEMSQILDLFDTTVTVPTGRGQVRYQSPFVSDPIAMEVFMLDLMDSITTSDSPVMPGRININECPLEILSGIPNLSEEGLAAILENRDPSNTDPMRSFGTWPLAEGYLTLTEMRSLVPLFCGSGAVYRAQVVGFINESGINHRSEVILDATTVNPRIVYLRDLSHLGRGFDRSVLGNRMMAAAVGPTN